MAYSSFFQSGPDPRLFGGNGAYGMPQGGMGLPGMPFGGPQMPSMGGGGGGQGGWLGALGRAGGAVGGWLGENTGWNDMEGMERAYMLASVGGGVADFFERRGERNEEQRRYEQALEESERHKRRMGENLNAAWGG